MQKVCYFMEELKYIAHPSKSNFGIYGKFFFLSLKIFSGVPSATQFNRTCFKNKQQFILIAGIVYEVYVRSGFQSSRFCL